MGRFRCNITVEFFSVNMRDNGVMMFLPESGRGRGTERGRSCGTRRRRRRRKKRRRRSRGGGSARRRRRRRRRRGRGGGGGGRWRRRRRRRWWSRSRRRWRRPLRTWTPGTSPSCCFTKRERRKSTELQLPKMEAAGPGGNIARGLAVKAAASYWKGPPEVGG